MCVVCFVLVASSNHHHYYDHDDDDHHYHHRSVERNEYDIYVHVLQRRSISPYQLGMVSVGGVC